MIRRKPRYDYLLMLFVVAISFFLIVVLNRRNYQDAWILDGIVVPTAIFIFSFLVAEVFIRDNKKVVILAAFLLAAMNLIPGLKYQSFSGVFDGPAHFRFTNEMVSRSYIPENEFLSEMYGGNPAMHVFMASFSIVSGISTNEVLSLIIPALSGLIPFIIYFATKGILDDTIQRYVIIASSFPIVQRYIIYGTSLALLPYFLLIAIFVRNIFGKECKRRFGLIFIILGFNVIISHAITSFLVFFAFALVLLILWLLEITRKKTLGRIRVSTLVIPTVIYGIMFLAWWSVASDFNLKRLASLMKALFVGEVRAPVPTRFYDIPLLAQVQILAVFHLSDAIVVMLSLFGLSVFLWKLRRKVSSEAKTFYLYLIVLLTAFVSFLLFQFVSGFGSIEYERLMAYIMLLCIFLVGLTLWRLDEFLNRISVRPAAKNLVFASLLFILVSSCLIQFHRCQPLVPGSNVLSSDLPEEEYLVQLGVVNTIYQIEMISFAEKYSYNSSVASDVVTRFQIHGFSTPSFYLRHIRFNLLESNQSLNWDLLLLHTFEGGQFEEPAEYRTKERIENLRLEAGNLIYDNGASFIISHSMYNPDATQD